MKKLQFVWYGWSDFFKTNPFQFVRIRPEMNIRKIYRWVLYLGPLEIRRWV